MQQINFAENVNNLLNALRLDGVAYFFLYLQCTFHVITDIYLVFQKKKQNKNCLKFVDGI